MPNSNFTGSINGNGDYDLIEDAWNAFIAGLVQSGVSVLGSTLQQIVVPVPVADPPAVDTDGIGTDVKCTAPDFPPEEHVTYTHRFTDNGGYDWTNTTYEAAPNEPVTLANAYSPGRQFSIFANETPGALTTPLP